MGNIERKLMDNFMNGLWPLMNTAVRSLPKRDRETIGTLIQNGEGRLVLTAEIGTGDKTNVQIIAKLPNFERTLYTASN